MPEGKTNVLIIEDDGETRDGLARALKDLGYVPIRASSGEDGLAAFTARRPAVVLLDVRLPGMDGVSVLHEIKQMAPDTSVVVVSGQGDVGTIVKTMKLGAADFLKKPFDTQDIALVLAAVWKQRALRGEMDALQNQLSPDREDATSALWLGGSFFQQLQGLISQIADTNATVLLQGESGVGKGTVAQIIHAGSSRRDRPFIKVNCAALPAELLESELFGYERGAFTGAARRKPGKFDLAHGGTLVLDEVADLPTGLQAKLLHVLQDGEFSRLGGDRDVKVDVRIIATANRDLEGAVKAETFREDLYYRLNVVSLLIPPLRERREEIPVLAHYFQERYARQYNRRPPPLSAATLHHFTQYSWPGNVRELENVVKRIVILETEAFVPAACPITMPDLPETPPAPRTTRRETNGGLKEAARRAAREAERTLIKATLDETRWNRVEAARRLQISYKALLYKIRACGL